MDTADLPTPILVNSVAVNGFLNGICNFAFSALQWYPETVDDETKVRTMEKIVVDLRMDLFCAQQLRDALDRIIEANTRPKVSN